MPVEPYLSDKEIRDTVLSRIEAYEDLSALEKYALFMGKAQILELGFKGILARIFGIPFDKMSKWTLGRVKNEMEQQGIRPDFIELLNSVVDHRNYIAHEFLVNNAITTSLANFSDRFQFGDLHRAIYELEQIIVLYDWCQEHNGWQ